MAKVSKRYAEAAKLVDRSKTYSIEEAVKLAKERGIEIPDKTKETRGTVPGKKVIESRNSIL